MKCLHRNPNFVAEQKNFEKTMKVSPHVKVLVALLFTLMAMTCSVDCKPVTTTTKKPKPNLTYAAGPNQLTLLMVQF